MTVESLITQHIDTWTSAIKTQSTSGRGSRKKLDLYGIKKLRELILELAVRGKLVPQDPNDEPASVLLERIAAEKAQLVKDKKISKPKKSPQITEDEKSEKLPEGWQLCRFGELYNLEYGDNLPKTKRSESGEYPVYGSNGIVGTHSEFSVNEACIVVGRKGSAGALNKSTTPCWATDVAYSVTPPNGITLDYCFLHLSTFGLDALGKGIKPGLNRNEANILIASIPPTKEQHRIVAKVDELMSLCDQLEQQTEASIEAHQLLVSTLLNTLTNSADADELMGNWVRISDHFDTLFTTEASIDQLKQIILQLAVMGKLVPQDPNDEPASVLLERIAEEKAQLIKDKKIKKQKELPPIADDEKPFDLPNGWEWCRLPDLGELARGKSKHRPRNDPKLYDGGDIPLVQTGDVARSNGVIETYTAQYNEFGLKQSHLWPKGTLCITIAANIADTGILGFDACFPDSVVGFTPYDQNIPTVYFDYFIRTAKENLEKFAPSTAQKNINLEILSNVLVPCPPFKEYKRIVEQIQVMHDICDKLKQCLNNRQNIQLKLTDAIIEQVV